MQFDLQRVSVKPFAYALIIAPLLFLISDLMTSGIWDDDQTTFLANVADNEARHYAGNVIGVLGAFGLVVAVAGIALLVRTKRRRLGTIAGSVALVGAIFLPGAWLVGTAFENVAASDSARSTLAGFFERSEDSAVLTVTWIVPFSMLLLGTIALAVGLFIGRVVPRWIPVVLALGLLVTFFAEDGAGTYISSALMIVALGAIGVTLLREGREPASSPLPPPDTTAPAAT